MVKISENHQGSSTIFQELNQLKQLCDKYDAGEDISYSAEFNSILDRADKANVTQYAGQNELLGYINLTLGNMCFNEQNYEQALTHYNVAAYYISKIDNRPVLAIAIQGISDSHLMLDQYAKVLEYNPIVLNYYKEVKEEAKAADSAYNMAESYLHLNDYPKAVEFAFQALNYYEKVSNTKSKAFSYFQIGQIYSFSENYTEAARFYAKAIEIHQQLNWWDSLITDYIELGDTYFLLAQNKNARAAYLDALKLLQKNDNPKKLKRVYSRLIKVCFQLTDYKNGIYFGQKATELYDKEDSSYDLVDIYYYMGIIYYVQRDYSNAFRNFTEADSRCGLHFDEEKYTRIRGEINNHLFNCCYAMNQVEFGLRYLNEAVKINTENGYLENLADNYRQLAKTYLWEKEDPKKAYDYCINALDILKQVDVPLVKGKVYELMGDIQLDMKYHIGKIYFARPVLYEIIDKLNNYRSSRRVDPEVEQLRNKIKKDVIDAYTTSLVFYRLEGKDDKVKSVTEKISRVRSEL